MKLLFKNKLIIITISIIVLFTTTFLTYEFIISKEKVTAPPATEIKHNVVFNLLEPVSQEIEVNNEYIELGATVKIDNIDKTADIIIDSSALDVNKVGEYNIRYKVIVDDEIYQETRKVIVKDTINPTIKLKGSNNLILLLNEPYKEYGCEIEDNYDKDLKDKLEIKNNINIKAVGSYKVHYSITDSSGNKASISRNVTVKKPNIIKQITNDKGNDVKPIVVDEGITLNSWTNNGFYIKGKHNGLNESFSLKLKKSEDEAFEEVQSLEKINNTEYKGSINLSNLSNGNYLAYLVGKEETPLINKLGNDFRIKRSKVGNKLITMTYTNNQVSFKVEDFAYQYDILIDAGHGGQDGGAYYGKVFERDVNLKQTLYEYNRYRELGLTVKLIREDSGTGIMMGDSDWKFVRRRAYAIGYLGVVSRISYSNHHNSIGNSYFRGFEILLPAATTSAELVNEKRLYSLWSTYYKNNYNTSLDNHMRFYTRNYDTEQLKNKINGETYTFTDYYAVHRIPYKLFNVKNVIYEGCYMSNINDFNWYYNEEHWKELSELKIKTYVEALGYTYTRPN